MRYLKGYLKKDKESMTLVEFYEVKKILDDRSKCLEFYCIPTMPAVLKKWLESRIATDTEMLKALGLEE